jgi:hypothetical protein
MKNLYLIPTDKPSRLFLKENTLLLNNQYTLQKIFTKGKCQNIYITSDEEIKDGDWIIYKNKVSKIERGDNELFHLSKKIILTIDQDLIKYGVQAIDDTFLEWFIKNSSCESVEIRDYKLHFGSTIYKIIITKEETKQETIEEVAKEYASRYGEIDIVINKAVRFGAKWQAERMYSEEEVLELIWKYETRKTSMVGYGNVKKWFEQFKKK